MSGYPTSLDERARAALLRALIGMPPRVLRLLAGPAVVRDGQTLDPEAQLLLRLTALEGRAPIDELGVAEGRAEVLRTVRPASGRPVPMADVRDVQVQGAAGPLPARLFVPFERAADRRSPLLLFFHGGGWVTGDIDSHDPPCRLLASAAGVRVLSVGYRLAPEHRFPAAPDDAYAAFLDVHANAAAHGADPDRIAVGGDSAGGTIAATCALRAVADGGPAPAFQLLIYPATDNSGAESASYRMFSEGFLLTANLMAWFRGHYFGPDQATLGAGPDASPLLADDVAGVAPAHVVTAGFDPLRDEGEAYAARLADAGVPATTRRHTGLTHAFINLTGVGRTAREAVVEMGGVLRAGLAGAPVRTRGSASSPPR